MEDKQMIKQTKFGYVDLSELKRSKNGTGQINWKKSVGCKVRFKYQDIKSNIIINDFLGDGYINISIIGYAENYVIKTNSVLNGRLGIVVGKITSEFRYKIGDIVNENLMLTSAYINKGRKYYTYTCIIDGYNGHIFENDMISGKGCPVCARKKVMRGVNDIATTRPDIANLLWNSEDAYVYSAYSNKNTNFRCPRCGTKINSNIHNVSIFGLSCKKCGDGISYPEKFVFNFLQQVGNLHKDNIQIRSFEIQKMFDWSKNILHQNIKLSGNKKYDFYIPLENEIIIETHGMQHYEECLLHTYSNARTLLEEQENDILKMNLAISNGIFPQNYIQLDCRYSDMNYIKDTIMSSILPELLNFKEEDIDWNECNCVATSSRVYEVCILWNDGVRIKDIANKMKLTDVTIRNYLRRGFELGILQTPPKYLLKA